MTAIAAIQQGPDEQRLNAFLGRVIDDLGGAYSASLVKLGDRLGLYRALHDRGPLSAAELAEHTGCARRYIEEWLAHQAASGYVEYEAASGRFRLPPEQAMVFADPDSPVYMIGGFENAASTMLNEPLVADAFRHGGGVSWGDQAECMFCAVAKFFRPGYVHNLVQHWLPALDGVVEKLERGARVADIGCGHGHSTLIMAEAFPNSSFVGFDFHPDSIAAAEAHRDALGLDAERVRFETATAKDFVGGPYDLLTCFDALHDMGDPAGVAAHVRTQVAADGTWMIVEPMAGDTLEQNLNPVSRLFYAASTMICVPTALAQHATALGAQAGEAKLAGIIGSGGFGRIARAAETPFNIVLEARP